jgi:hypothetical protein
MTSRKTGQPIIVSLALCALAMSGLHPIQAAAAPVSSPQSLSEDSMETIRSGLHNYGVSSHTADALVQKLRRGETWDSMNGSAPIATSTIESSRSQTTTQTYADGSVSRISVEMPERTTGAVEPRAVRSCRVSQSGSTKTFEGCWVSGGTVIVTAGFSVKYRTTPGGAQILQTGRENITILSLGAGWKDVRRNITRASATRTLPATARLSFVPTGATFGTTSWLEFRVTRGGATSTGFSF